MPRPIAVNFLSGCGIGDDGIPGNGLRGDRLIVEQVFDAVQPAPDAVPGVELIDPRGVLVQRELDKDLDETAEKLNSIIEETTRDNKDKDRRLTFLVTGKGIVLAWENTGGRFLTEDDNTEKELLDALGL